MNEFDISVSKWLLCFKICLDFNKTLAFWIKKPAYIHIFMLENTAFIIFRSKVTNCHFLDLKIIMPLKKNDFLFYKNCPILSKLFLTISEVWILKINKNSPAVRILKVSHWLASSNKSLWSLGDVQTLIFPRQPKCVCLRVIVSRAEGGISVWLFKCLSSTDTHKVHNALAHRVKKISQRSKIYINGTPAGSN